MNLYEDVEFVFNTAYDFKNRFAGEPDYFTNKGEQKGLLLETNFVADAVNLPLISAKERGAGGGHIRFNMAKGSMNSHISQFPVGTYKKGHRHGPGAHVIILSGEGYSLMWPEGEEPRRYDWEVGTMIVPPNMWFHQHFNTGTTPVALSRLQARGRVDPQRARRAEGLDQPAHRRRPDRLRRRDAARAHPVRRGARQARAQAEDGRGLPGRASRPAAEAGRAGGLTVNVDKEIMAMDDSTRGAGLGHNSGATVEKEEPVWERWTKKRVFVRALEGTYGELVQELFTQPRVYHTKDWKWKGGPQNYGKKIINPQSVKVAQSIETHIDVFAPGGYGQKHGHMNSAVFFVLKGKGHDVHDGKRHDWEAGDALIVENGCVHQHFNDEPDDECIVPDHEGEAAVPVHAHDVPEGGRLSAEGARCRARQTTSRPPTCDLSGESMSMSIVDPIERAARARRDAIRRLLRQGARGLGAVPRGVRRPPERREGEPDADRALARRPHQAHHQREDGHQGVLPRHLHAVPSARKGERQAPPPVGGGVLRRRGQRLRPALGRALRLQGRVRMGVGRGAEALRMGQGDFVYIPPYCAHKHFNADAGNEARIVVINSRIMKPMGFDWFEQLENAEGY